MSNDALIFDAIRTPRGRGKATGALHEVKPVTLLTGLLNTLQERNRFATQAVDDIVMGCVTAVGDQGAVIAKTAALAAGWNDDVAGMVLNRFCASGLEAVNIAAMKIRSGWEHLVVAGGVESMSRVPMGSDGGAWAQDPETNFRTGFMPQGIGADLIATLGGYSRADVDQYAATSHHRAAAAWAKGAFGKSVIPVLDRNGVLILDHDELIRADSTVATLSTLKPSFERMGAMGFDGVARARYPQVEAINHVHTPGNSSGIVDGASAVLIGSPAAGKQFGMTPRARIIATAVVGSDPTIMLTGPAPAARKALNVAGMAVTDIDLFEVNEAFASVVLRFMDELEVNHDRVNVNGGAIAMGHPLGATGAMILGTLLDELEARDLNTGLATLCVGGGMGIATIIERLQGRVGENS
ncbi:acetyl-CoA C-acetyltransferase [Marinobacter sp. X15-166B]|uniref:acetyl-CoA C-acetyltransferase n=1 Tax=Marinobacter sp. X15-166B TaxID=1897620 RepID=UPI00085CC0AB|nr:acetyl-CoA C-acetyltransferase [Marinobacter sp. X15-166B]OEY65983.1 acetyl-CoA acetyltransferase [Marinobacter sp. X15-166B]